MKPDRERKRSQPAEHVVQKSDGAAPIPPLAGLASQPDEIARHPECRKTGSVATADAIIAVVAAFGGGRPAREDVPLASHGVPLQDLVGGRADAGIGRGKEIERNAWAEQTDVKCVGGVDKMFGLIRPKPC